MEQYKEIVNDPAKLQASLKEAWAKIDVNGKGFVNPQEFGAGMAMIAQTMKVPGMKPPTEEEKERFKKILDPEGTGKITFEGFVRLANAGIEKAKKEGKI